MSVIHDDRVMYYISNASFPWLLNCMQNMYWTLKVKPIFFVHFPTLMFSMQVMSLTLIWTVLFFFSFLFFTLILFNVSSVYLHKILRNHTAHACDGDTLEIRCPSKTTIAILSAFYGRRVPSQYLCPTTNPNITLEEDTECTSPVAVQVLFVPLGNNPRYNAIVTIWRSWYDMTWSIGLISNNTWVRCWQLQH